MRGLIRMDAFDMHISEYLSKCLTLSRTNSPTLQLPHSLTSSATSSLSLSLSYFFLSVGSGG